MTTEPTADQIERCAWAYYQALRRYMSQYAAISDAFPTFLKGSKRLLAVLGRDGGILSHWPSEHDSFEFQRVEESVQKLAAPYNLNLSVTTSSGKQAKIMISGLEVVNSTTGEIFRTPWDTVEVWWGYDPREWDEAVALARAAEDALTFVAGHHLHVTGTVPPDKLRSEVLRRLQVMINRFDALLKSSPKEENIQQFLAENQTLLHPVAVQLSPKVALGTEYVTDYAIELTERRYILVEIEQSNHSLFNRKGDPSAALTHARRQVEDWREWIEEHGEYARHTLPDIGDPECWVVIGRGHVLSENNRRSLRRMNKETPRIRVMTYDDLLDEARQHLRNLIRLHTEARLD